jgi:hypothetical protein
MHALAFDERGYVQLSGPRPPEKVFTIVAQERGRGYDQPPIVEGRPLDLARFMASRLAV